jgi:transposase
MLPLAKRVLILNMLVEGSSLRSISRVAEVSINTVTKLLVDAGETAIDLHDKLVRNVEASKVQCDEIWSFNYCKQGNAGSAKAAPMDAGDVWTWTAIEADTKLIVTYAVGDRTLSCARLLMEYLKERLANRVQITSDGHRAYVEAVEGAFGDDVDFAQPVKIYGPGGPPQPGGKPWRQEDRGHRQPRYPARLNVKRRARQPFDPDGQPAFTRLTDAFPKKIDNHLHALGLFFLHYNFARIHKSLKVTPAMAAGVSKDLWTMERIAEEIEVRRPSPGERGPYEKRAP